VTVHASAVTPNGGREAASLVVALFGFGLMATHAGLVKPVLVGLFDTHMRIVAVNTGEIDVCVVLVEVAFVRALEAGTHLKSLCMSRHNKRGVTLVRGHIHRKNGV